jgi:hypothetical protein
MQIRRSHVTVAIIASLVVAGTVFVQRQLARNRINMAKATQAQDKSNVPIAPRGSQMLLNNPDGVEFERTIVPDAPFSAKMIIESSERMPDGSLTNKTTTSLIYRDSKGRTRRDWLPEILSSTTADPTRSVIHDAVAGFTYELDHRATSAKQTILARSRMRTSAGMEAAAKQAGGRSQMLPVPTTIGTGNALQPTTANSAPANKPESLGSQNIEGILAEGTRLKVTLPAGKIGNDKPVEITVERWYAPGLQTVILVKRTDSRTGETTYRLTDINRNEPAAALFTVPSNYKIIDQTGREIRKSP